MIVELQAERQRLDEAIEALERLSTRSQARRGRPPRWMKDMEADSNGHEPEKAEAKKPS